MLRSDSIWRDRAALRCVFWTCNCLAILLFATVFVVLPAIHDCDRCGCVGCSEASESESDSPCLLCVAADTSISVCSTGVDLADTHQEQVPILVMNLTDPQVVTLRTSSARAPPSV